LAPVGIVAALKAEAKTLGSAQRHGHRLLQLHGGALLAVSGIGNEAATRAARSLVDAGAASLVSWGVAGALDPLLRAGDLVLPREVITRDSLRFAASAAWRDALAATLARLSATGFSVVDGVLLTTTTAIDSVEDKAEALRTTLAVAVDMESAAVAQVAAARALPFIAVRAIVDTAADRLPHAVLAASRAGQVQLWRLARELARSPREITALLRLARRYRVAERTLRRVADAGIGGPPHGSAARA
jgi:adenosylhomocysteine nucleosidase